MRLRALLLLCLIGLTNTALAEGGCPQGMTPVNNGQNWTCIPGGNDPAGGQVQQPTAPPQPTGWWEKTWGAIATSESGGALGTALGASDKEQAERLAMADCKAKGGGGCKIGIAYHNQCAVMLVGDGVAIARAGSIEQAKADGMESCKEKGDTCRVYYSACTEPKFHRY